MCSSFAIPTLHQSIQQARNNALKPPTYQRWKCFFPNKLV